jgi:hypothetical protein
MQKRAASPLSPVLVSEAGFQNLAARCPLPGTRPSGRCWATGTINLRGPQKSAMVEGRRKNQTFLWKLVSFCRRNVKHASRVAPAGGGWQTSWNSLSYKAIWQMSRFLCLLKFVSVWNGLSCDRSLPCSGALNNSVFWDVMPCDS